MGLPNELGVGRINRLLNRLLAIKGRAPAPVLMPELNAAIILENDRPEYHFLGGGYPFSAEQLSNASVGNFSCVGLRNPPNTGLLVVVTSIAMATGGTNHARWGALNAPLLSPIDGSQTIFPSDLRTDPRSPIQTFFRQQAGSMMGNQAGIIRSTGASVLLRCSIILPPNSEIRVQPAVVNEQITMSVEGYARHMDPSET